MRTHAHSRRHTRSLRLLVGAGLLTSLGLVAAPAHAQPIAYTFVVNTTADTHDVATSDGACSDLNGRCSLRAATEQASSTGYPAGTTITIRVPSGTYTLSLGELALGQPYTSNTNSINTQHIVMLGAGATATTVTGNNSSRVFSVYTTVTLQSLTVTGGLATDVRSCGNGSGACGGGIFDFGSLILSNDVVSGNTASASVTGSSSNQTAFAAGGGIVVPVYLPLTLINTTVSNNHVTATGTSCSVSCTVRANADGGGIHSYNGSITIFGGAIRGNTAVATSQGTCPPTDICHFYATSRGGGMYNDEQVQIQNASITGNTVSVQAAYTCPVSTCTAVGQNSGGGIFNDYQMYVSRSTVSGNQAPGANGLGGGIYDNSNDVLNQVTVTGNSAGQRGGGIFNDANLQMQNSTISSNTAGSQAVNGQGGGIYNENRFSAIASTFTSNSAYDGGGIFQLPGSSGERNVSLRNSTVQYNHAAHFGGGIDDERTNSNGEIQLTSSSITNNTAGTEGGGVYNLSTIAQISSPVTTNTAPTCANTVIPCT